MSVWIEIIETTLDMRKDSLFVFHDNHGIIFFSNFDFALIVYGSLRGYDCSHGNNGFSRSQ